MLQNYHVKLIDDVLNAVSGERVEYSREDKLPSFHD
jgi:hypothetical protein